MIHRNRIAFAVLVSTLALGTSQVSAAEPTADMRALAKLFATLDAQNQTAYCNTLHVDSYAGYLERVCQSAVKHKVKKTEECTAENIAQQVKTDHQQCLKMTRAEFDKVVIRGREASKTFIETSTAQGVDGAKLLQDERAKLR